MVAHVNTKVVVDVRKLAQLLAEGCTTSTILAGLSSSLDGLPSSLPELPTPARRPRGYLLAQPI